MQVGWLWVTILILTIMGQTREYFKFKAICTNFMPHTPIHFQYSWDSGDIAGTYFKGIVSVRVGGNGEQRLRTLYHELGHAATFALPNPNALILIFDNIGRGPGWETYCVSKYAQTSALEDIAETFSNVMTKFRPWNPRTRSKARAVCDHFSAIGIKECIP